MSLSYGASFFTFPLSPNAWNSAARTNDRELPAGTFESQSVVNRWLVEALRVPPKKAARMIDQATQLAQSLTPTGHTTPAALPIVREAICAGELDGEHVDAIARRLGAEAKDQVPFEKYAKAAESLLKPSSAARAVSAGAPFIERVDLLVKLISHQLGMANVEIDGTVDVVDQKLNERIVAGGAGLP